MTPLERIKELCRIKKNISITTLEQELGYSNGSLAKAKDIPSSRICEIALYLEVSMDYIMLGREINNPIYSSEMANLLLKIQEDKILSTSLESYFNLSNEKKKHVVNTIEILSK